MVNFWRTAFAAIYSSFVRAVALTSDPTAEMCTEQCGAIRATLKAQPSLAALAWYANGRQKFMRVPYVYGNCLCDTSPGTNRIDFRDAP